MLPDVEREAWAELGRWARRVLRDHKLWQTTEGVPLLVGLMAVGKSLAESRAATDGAIDEADARRNAFVMLTDHVMRAHRWARAWRRAAKHERRIRLYLEARERKEEELP